MINDQLTKEKILEKVRKLMVLAGDEGASLNEAEVAAKKAQELLFKYNLTMQEADTHIPKDEQVVGDEFYDLGPDWKKNEGSWIISLYQCIARYNLCTIVVGWSYARDRYPKNWAVYVIGRKVNVELVHFMCQQLVFRIRILEKGAWLLYQGLEKKGRFRRGFLVGAVKGISNQLWKQQSGLRGVEKKLDALIVLNEKALEEYSKRRWPDQTKGRMSSLSSWDGLQKGIVAGKSMEIHKGLEEGSNSFGGLLRE